MDSRKRRPPLNIRARIIANGSLIYIRFSGVQTPGLLVNELERLHTLPEFRPGLPEFADLSRVTEDLLDFNAMRRVAREANCQAHTFDVDKRIACYAPNDMMFGMARMFATLCDLDPGPAEAQAFRTMAEALAWLGRPETRLEDIPGFETVPAA